MTTEEPKIRQGERAIEKPNVNAASDEHPLANSNLEIDGDIKSLIREYADGQYSSGEETVREYLANAETACRRVLRRQNSDKDVIVNGDYEPVIEVMWDKKQSKFIIKDNGIGMSSYEFEHGFNYVGASTSRGVSDRSGKFGFGSLSFAQIAGVDNSILIGTHSRISDENYAMYFSLGGSEPLPGEFDDDEYGTKFEIPVWNDVDIRNAVETYAEYLSVPVKYEEYGKNGSLQFEEDYGDKQLVDDYDTPELAATVSKEGYFTAHTTPEAGSKTLLISMEIDRTTDSNDERYNSLLPFDIQLHDESGRVVTGPNEGFIPTARSDYEAMLKDARDPYITPEMVDETDAIVEGDERIYATDLDDEELIGTEIDVGPNSGKVVMEEAEWNDLDEGIAGQYIPEDELTDEDITLPKPTSDRGRLVENEEFWDWVSEQLLQRHLDFFTELAKRAQQSDEPIEQVKAIFQDEIFTDFVDNTLKQ